MNRIYTLLLPIIFIFGAYRLSGQTRTSECGALIKIIGHKIDGSTTQQSYGFFIDSCGTAVSFHNAFIDTKNMEFETIEGQPMKLNTIIGFDKESGLIKFRLEHGPCQLPYYKVKKKKLHKLNHVIFPDITAASSHCKQIDASVVSEKEYGYFGQTYKIQVEDNTVPIEGTPILNAKNEAVGIFSGDKSLDGNYFFGISLENISNMSPYDPSVFNTYHYKGVVALSMGNLNEARNYFNQSLQLNPKDPITYLRLGEVKFADQDFYGAINDYSKVTFLRSEDDYVFYSMGMAYFELQLYNQATDMFTTAIRFNPQNTKAIKMRGETRYVLGSFQAAMSDIEKAIQMKKDYAEAYLIRGLCYASMKNKKKACNDFQRALDLGLMEVAEYLPEYCK